MEFELSISQSQLAAAAEIPNALSIVQIPSVRRGLNAESTEHSL